MSIKRACEIVGGQSKLASKLGISPAAVHRWLKRGEPPATRVLQIEQATGGKVHRTELRPDIYPPGEP